MVAEYVRRSDIEPFQVGDYYMGARRYFDQNFGITVIKLVSGDCYVTTAHDEMLVTILGSCVSACIRDPVSGVAGMNHFLLPGGPGSTSNGTTADAARYGAYAMELLINRMVAHGAVKTRMQVKLFGGGDVTESSTRMGTRNVEFVKDYMTKEGLSVVSCDLGGRLPRRVHFFSDDGRVLVRSLARKDDLRIVAQESQHEHQLIIHTWEGSIELFN